ncbi:hypothetical protein ACQKJG_18780 [Priestia megaterium]|uniref:hypothetical protein n=1 Tax=Priestia megaterium TaxID=1404 RepID=UPI003D046D3C
MVNQLIRLEDQLQFDFFVPDHFEHEYLLENIIGCYQALDEGGREPLVASSSVARRARYLYEEGVVARICRLQEDFPENLFFPFEYNDLIRNLYMHHDRDIEIVLDEIRDLSCTFPDDERLMYLYRTDVEKILSLYRISHVQGPHPYGTLRMLRHTEVPIGNDLLVESLISSNPIVKVW